MYTTLLYLPLFLKSSPKYLLKSDNAGEMLTTILKSTDCETKLFSSVELIIGKFRLMFCDKSLLSCLTLHCNMPQFGYRFPRERTRL